MNYPGGFNCTCPDGFLQGEGNEQCQTCKLGFGFEPNEWTVNEIDCWRSECNFSGGFCPGLCGRDGYCCSQNPDNQHLNGDCPDEAITAIERLTATSGHICIKKTGKIIILS